MEDTTIVLRNARLVFPNLAEPKPVMRNGRAVGDPKYSVTVLLDDEQQTEVARELAKAIRAKWPGRNIREDVQYNRLHWPIVSEQQAKSSAEQRGKDGRIYEGYSLLKADSKFPPMLYDGRKQLDPARPDAARIFYSGCYANVQLNVSAYDGVSGGKDGVKTYLQAVVKTKDGDRLIGGGVRDEVFAGVEGGESDYDPTGGASGVLDDEIPF